MKPEDVRWQRTRILYDKEHPHLMGMEVWTEVGKPRLYHVGGKKRIRLVLSNLRAVKDSLGHAAFRPRHVERIGHAASDFAHTVTFVSSSVWTDKQWTGVEWSPWGEYELSEGWTRETEPEPVSRIEGADLLAGWGSMLNLRKIGPIDSRPLSTSINPQTRYGRQLLHMLRALQSSTKR